MQCYQVYVPACQTLNWCVRVQYLLRRTTLIISKQQLFPGMSRSYACMLLPTLVVLFMVRFSVYCQSTDANSTIRLSKPTLFISFLLESIPFFLISSCFLCSSSFFSAVAVVLNMYYTRWILSFLFVSVSYLIDNKNSNPELCTVYQVSLITL